MATFTFIADYQGGTYVGQQTADELHAACYLWKDKVVSDQYIQSLDVNLFADAFDSDIEELPPVALDEVINIWLFQLLIKDDLLSLHIIQTDISQLNSSKLDNRQ